MNDTDGMASGDADAQPAVGSRVCVHPGMATETRGVVVEDFGETAGSPVDIGPNHIADAARRWAVMLDSGALVFVDSDDLLAE